MKETDRDESQIQAEILRELGSRPDVRLFRNEEKNHEITIARGWKFRPDISERCPWWDENDLARPDGPPDHFNDLNAMHEAEKVLDNGHIIGYVQRLERGALSTAAQRAEAFGRTLNLWTE